MTPRAIRRIGVPLTATGAVPLAAAIDAARPAGLSPSTVDPGYKNASLRAWNVNLQRQLTPKLAVMGGYSGSHGSNLRISRNINQPVAGVRPFAAIAATSAIAPGAVLGNITEVTSLGFSNYDAAWISISRRDARGLQLEASYTLSKSLDTNSLNSIGFAVQDGNNIAAEYGPVGLRRAASIRAQRHLRAAVHGECRHARLAARGGGAVAERQPLQHRDQHRHGERHAEHGPSRRDGTDPDHRLGRPVVRSGAVRRRGPVRHPVAECARGACLQQHRHHGDQGGEAWGLRLQFRADVFDVFNHPNFASPGNIVGSPSFGKITRTRLPTGEAGSSRQIQLSLRLAF